MPEQYEAIKKKFLSEGTGEAEAKTRAAKIYNSQNPDNPVGPHYDEANQLVDKHYKSRKKRGDRTRQVKAAEAYLSSRKK